MNVRLIESAIAILFGACLACITSGRIFAADLPAAIVNGKRIEEKELGALVGAQLQQLRKQEYDLKRRALEELIEKELMAAEAARRGISVDQLIQELVSSVPEPTDAETEAFYLAQGGERQQPQKPFSEVRGQVRSYLQNARIRQTREKFVRELRGRGNVRVLLEPPRTAVSLDPDRRKGAASAPVSIVVFSDFQCQHCATIRSTLYGLLDKNRGRIALGFRDFPIEQIHPHAQKAAEASRCAAEQGKFWEYHDLLFANQQNLEPGKLRSLATEANLDAKAFDACLESGKHSASVQADFVAGRDAGVAGTPALFVNGRLISGAARAETIQDVIDEELSRAGVSTAR
jgi:protein-disulfide isomerase